MKVFKVLFTTVAMALIISCGDDVEPIGPKLPTGEISYLGKATTGQSDGSSYEQDSVVVTLDLFSDNKTLATMVMNAVKFASKMPGIDMTIDSVSVETNAKVLLLSGENIVPIAMGGPFLSRIITHLHGTVTQDSLIVSMNGGDSPMSFRGGLKK
ncbi:hypothetical protein AGMMS49525_12030 [Bacteroidia bacterium]|nr:hypothetical protein AGMMS49525_12030 [Bacteroidia bacterium]